MKKPNSYKPPRGKAKVFSLYDTSKWYKSVEWVKYRLRFLFHNPKCYICGATATVVDHIRSHRGSIEWFEKLTNHLPLCKGHHDTITALFDRHLDKNVDEIVKEKIEWIEKNKKTNIKVKVLPLYRSEE